MVFMCIQRSFFQQLLGKSLYRSNPQGNLWILFQAIDRCYNDFKISKRFKNSQLLHLQVYIRIFLCQTKQSLSGRQPYLARLSNFLESVRIYRDFYGQLYLTDPSNIDSSPKKHCIGNIRSCSWYWIIQFFIRYIHGKPHKAYVGRFLFLLKNLRKVKIELSHTSH